MYKAAIKIFLLLVVINANGQTSRIQQKIAEDYNYFCELMYANPQLDVRNKVQKLHLKDSLEAYKNQVKKCKNYKEFAFLLDQICNIFNDNHLYAATFNQSFSKKDIKLNSDYNKYIWKAKRSNITLPHLHRENGKYYFDQNLLIIRKKQTDTIIGQGMELIQLDGLSPQEFILKTFKQSRHNKWDYSQKMFYRLVLANQNGHDYIKLKVKDKTKEKNITIEKRGLFKMFRKFYIETAENKIFHKTRLFKTHTFNGTTALYSNQKVYYLSNKKILYIRLRSMFIDIDPIINQIVKHKKSKIEKVVIDIRGNSGGSDLTWVNTLQHIIANVLVNEISYAYVDSKFLNYRIKDEFNDLDILDSATHVNLPFLEKEKYKLMVEKETIKPSENSLNFTGNIYILQDKNCYSAAGSLISLAERYESIINIGEPTGTLLGRGITPMTFILPNSRLAIQMHSVIDLSLAQTAKDVFHDKVEIPVKLNLKEKLQFYRDSKPLNEKFLLENDPWMKAVYNH
jgi:hypothetical protein